MKKFFATPATRAAATPGRRTIIAAALMAGLSAQALAATPIVISQVYGGGGNSGAKYKNDFIELFNRGNTAVDISGWSVQYASSTGSSWQVTKLAGNTVLQPGQYFLVQEAAGTGGTDSLPTADTTGTLALSGTTGKVALVSNVSALAGAAPVASSYVDLIGFGSAGYFEGSAAAPTLSNTTAALRAAAGCTDADNNGTDFSAGEPTPRNRASALHACGVPDAPPIVATCPASLSLAFGISGGADLSATDSDGIVNNAVITSAAVPGISLVNFLAASAAGGNATVSLNVAASVQANTYPVTIRFDNDQSQHCGSAAGRRHLRHADHHSLPAPTAPARRRHRVRPDRRARLRRDRRRRRWFKLQPTETPVFSAQSARDPPARGAGQRQGRQRQRAELLHHLHQRHRRLGQHRQGLHARRTTNRNCRGADNLNEFVRQRDKIVNELKAMDADVVGLMEIQNNGDTTVTYLVDALNEALNRHPTYAVRAEAGHHRHRRDPRGDDLQAAAS
jgi:hypothetical protein